MQLFCPACQSAFSGESRCPKCGGLLLMPQEATTELPRAHVAGYEPVRPTPAGRAVMGVLLALGLYLGLRKLATGWALAFEPDPEAWWLSFDGLRVVFGLQAAAVVFGGVIAAAGRPRGVGLGAVVGGLCGALFLAAEVLGGAPGFDLVMLVQPAVMLAAGAVAGVVGARVWPAAPDVDMPLPTVPNKLSSMSLLKERPQQSARPTAWVRVLAGAAIIVAGFATAERVRFGAQKYSGGALSVSSQGQGKFLSWQLATLAALAGGALAGAGTGAGIRHGVFAGFLAGVGLVAVGAAGGGPPAAMEYWLTRLQLKGLDFLHPGVIGGVVGGALIVGVVGGWLGGTLFLPLAPAHMRNRRLTVAGD